MNENQTIHKAIPSKSRPRNALASLLRILGYLLIWILLVLAVWFVLPASMTYSFVERYSFSAPAQNAEARLAVLIPQHGPYQQVKSSTVTWGGRVTTVSYPGVDILRLEGGLPAGTAVEAQIAYQVTLYQGPARWEGSTSAADILPQKNVESDASEIRALAVQLEAGSAAPDPYRIFVYTASRLSWPAGSRINTARSALEALRTGIGGCEEFANMMTALARAGGIPSRPVGGLALPVANPPFIPFSATWSHPGGAHAWVEIFVDGSWLLADPSWASAYPAPFRWLWYGRNDGSHLSYGEVSVYQQAYQDQETWVRQINRDAFAAMSAPMHFAAAASEDGVTVTPSITMTKTWDGRWAALVGAFAVWFASVALAERLLFAPPRRAGRDTGISQSDKPTRPEGT
jgi:transglutaminase-like putative cysteine protease